MSKPTSFNAQPIPPWERELIQIGEVPAYLRHKHNLNVKAITVWRWVRYGRKSRITEADRVFLRAQKRAGNRLWVRAVDLEAFLEVV